MDTVTIGFNNGTMISAEMNGSCYILDEKPDFPSDLSFVTVTSLDGTFRALQNPEIIECASIDGRYWFSFYEMPESERNVKQMQANIEYIAMMADVDLEEV